MAEKLNKKKVDICSLQKVQWKGQRACFIGVKKRTYKLWWLENDTGKNGVGILVKEELHESVVDIHKRSNRMMTMCILCGRK